MTQTEKAQMRVNCLYGAISIMGVNSSNFSPTTDEVLAEAKKLEKWVFGKKGDGE